MMFHLVTPVWGEAYTELFLTVVLPTLLSPGNLLAFARRGVRAVYWIYTRSEDAERIRQSPAFARLAEAMSAEIELIDELDCAGDSKYRTLARCHCRAIAAAEADGAGMMFPPPDEIWSEGAFDRLLALAAAGKRVALVPGVRVTKETFMPAVLERGLPGTGAGAPLGARELARLVLAHLHPYCAAQFWDSPCFNSWPSHVYWRVADRGFVARCFHMHPLMVIPRHSGAGPSVSLDADFVETACPDRDDYYVATDSDEILGCEISRRDQFGDYPPRRASARRVARWAAGAANAQHRSFFFHDVIRFHCGELSGDAAPEWRRVEAQARRVARGVAFWLRWGLLPFYARRRVQPWLGRAKARLRAGLSRT